MSNKLTIVPLITLPHCFSSYNFFYFHQPLPLHAHFLVSFSTVANCFQSSLWVHPPLPGVLHSPVTRPFSEEKKLFQSCKIIEIPQVLDYLVHNSYFNITSVLPFIEYVPISSSLYYNSNTINGDELHWNLFTSMNH